MESGNDEDQSLSVVIKRAAVLTGKDAEVDKRQLKKLQDEVSARVKAAGVTEEELQKLIDGKAQDCNR